MPALITALFVLGNLAFEAAEIPGIRLEAPALLTGETPRNFRHADLDGDGLPDLVFADAVAFQRDGRFPAADRAALPAFSQPCVVDVWDAMVYFKFPARLVAVAWDGADWAVRIDAPLHLPEAHGGGPPVAPRGHGMRPRLERFLHDLSGDGVPELVHAAQDGLHVFRREGDTYTAAGVLDVWPPTVVAPGPPPVLWPETRRRIAFPPRHMRCQVLVHGGRVTVVEQEDLEQQQVRYHRRDFDVLADDGGFTARPTGDAAASQALPGHLRPCRLNDNGGLHFAGRVREDSASRLAPGPVYTVSATLDGGHSFTRRRAGTFRAHAMFVDFNGNGALDLVTETTDLFDGGTRETFARYLTRSELVHTVHVYRQTGGGFTREPVLRKPLRLRLPAPPLFDRALFPRYRGGHGAGLVDLSGDFDGDGYKDLVVQDRLDRIAVYLASGFSYADTPDATLAVENVRSFGTADIDGDGRSDLVVQWLDTREDPPRERTFVYFSREAAP